MGWHARFDVALPSPPAADQRYADTRVGSRSITLSESAARDEERCCGCRTDKTVLQEIAT